MIKTDVSNYEELFYKAYRIRKVEEKISDIYSSDVIQSPVHLSIGQEHISVGVIENLRKTDFIFTTYRGHASYLAKGASLKFFFAELYGKATGFGKGKAGSMHLASKSDGVMGASAVVASTISHAVGAAYSFKLDLKDNVVVSFFGEGATGAGVYHESLNIAANLSVPLLFVCEFNDLAIFTGFSLVHSYNIKNHAESYGIECIQINEGWDIIKIHQISSQLIEKIRIDSKPRMLIINTCRYLQHVGPLEDDQLNYRDISALKEWKNKDPLITNKKLIEKFLPRIEKEIDEAIKFAEESPFPDKQDLYKDIF